MKNPHIHLVDVPYDRNGTAFVKTRRYKAANQTSPQSSSINKECPAMFTNTIVNADCLEFMPQLADKSVDFILTDPPYITSYKPRDGRTVPNDDNGRWLKPAFAEMFRVLDRDSFVVSFYGWPKVDQFMQAYRSAGFRVVGHFTFPKRYASGSRYVKYQHECAHLLVKGYPNEPEQTIGDVLDWSYTGNKLHPTQKPLSVLMPLIETFSKPGDLVLDPFAGSGSSLLAAKLLGRSYLGVELDTQYHVIAERRLNSQSHEKPV